MVKSDKKQYGKILLLTHSVNIPFYSHPRIDETLDCLNGAEWFPSLDLKSGYWQVEMEEDNKAFTAFTVGPLGFYEYECMPFGLRNVPTTFQWLMQSCLGNLH